MAFRSFGTEKRPNIYQIELCLWKSISTVPRRILRGLLYSNCKMVEKIMKVLSDGWNASKWMGITKNPVFKLIIEWRLTWAVGKKKGMSQNVNFCKVFIRACITFFCFPKLYIWSSAMIWQWLSFNQNSISNEHSIEWKPLIKSVLFRLIILIFSRIFRKVDYLRHKK